MKKKISKKAWRDPNALPAKQRKAGPMKDRRKKREKEKQTIKKEIEEETEK